METHPPQTNLDLVPAEVQPQQQTIDSEMAAATTGQAPATPAHTIHSSQDEEITPTELMTPRQPPPAPSEHTPQRPSPMRYDMTTGTTPARFTHDEEQETAKTYDALSAQQTFAAAPTMNTERPRSKSPRTTRSRSVTKSPQQSDATEPDNPTRRKRPPSRPARAATSSSQPIPLPDAQGPAGQPADSRQQLD